MEQNKQINRNNKNQFAGFSNWFYLWLVWPFAALIGALQRFRSPHAKNVVWLFCVFFGFVFVYANPFGEGGADSARYARNLIDLHQDWYSFDYLSTMFYSDEGTVDLYEPLVTWIVAFFTGNPRWLFTVFAAVFGWFYVQNLWMVFDKIDKRKKIDFVLLLFMVAFALVNPIWNINGVRMWTAAQVFIFGVLRYYIYKDKKGIIWIASSILFHFSFMFPVAIFLVYLLVPGNTTVWLIFFLAASFIRELDLSQVRSVLSFLPDFLQPRVSAYTTEAYYETILESRKVTTWHIQFSSIFGRWILYLWTFLVYFTRKLWLNRFPDVNKIYVFALFLGGFAQIAANVPSGGRFMLLVNMLMFSVFVIMMAQIRLDRKLQIWKIITLPFLLFYLIIQIRMGLDFIGISTFFSNPVLALFVEDTTPVIDFVKKIF